MRHSLRLRLLPAVSLLLVCASTSAARARSGPGDSSSASPARSGCHPNAQTLCFGSFAVSAEWQNPVDGSWRRALAFRRVEGVGYFGFFSRTNVELLVSMPPDGELSDFRYAQATTFKYSIRVVDTRHAGEVALFHEVPDFAHSVGCQAFCDGVVAFSYDIAHAGSCVKDDHSLCLANRTLRVQGTFVETELGASQLSNDAGVFYFDNPDGSRSSPWVLVKAVPVGGGEVAFLYGTSSPLPTHRPRGLRLSVEGEPAEVTFQVACLLPQACYPRD